MGCGGRTDETATEPVSPIGTNQLAQAPPVESSLQSAAVEEPEFIPGFPRFPGDSEPMCRQLALHTWNSGMRIAGASLVGDPPSGCEVEFTFDDGTPGYRVAERWTPSADPGWVYAPTGRAEERVETLDTGSTLWVDDLEGQGPAGSRQQALLLRSDGRLFVVVNEGTGFEPADEVARGLDRVAADGFRRGPPVPEPLDARPLAVPFVISHAFVHLEPPPAGMKPDLTPVQVARAAQLLLLSDWSEPGSELLLRFGVYYLTNPKPESRPARKRPHGW